MTSRGQERVGSKLPTILHLSFAYGEENTGITAAMEAIARLADGFSHRVMALSGEPTLPGWRGDPPVSIHYGRGGRFRWSFDYLVSVLGETVAAVHLHGLWTFASIAGSWKADWDRVPLIISPHGMVDPWALRKSWPKKIAAAAAYEGRTAHRATRFHAVSEREAHDLSRLGFGRRTCVIPNGASDDRIQQTRSTRAARSRNADGLRVLFLGRIDRKKGVLPLISAWLRLCRSHRNWELDLVGPWAAGLRNELGSDFEAMVGAGRIRVHGAVFGAEKWSFYANADIFVLPSFSEGMPVAAVEAIGVGVPSIVSPACGLEGAVRAGAAAESGPEAAAILAALEEVAAGRERRMRMEELGRDWYDRHLTPARLRDRWNHFYSGILTEDFKCPSY